MEMDRRAVLVRGVSVGVGVGVAIASPGRGAAADAPPLGNPLKLKGEFWENGRLYKKDDAELPTDAPTLLNDLKRLQTALASLEQLAEDGQYEQLQVQLRGGRFRQEEEGHRHTVQFTTSFYQSFPRNVKFNHSMIVQPTLPTHQ